MIKKYDLIIKGGILVDPAREIHNSKDIALVTGKVAEITDHIPEDRGRCVVDVSGRFVTPGLIDLHTHLFKGISNLGVDFNTYCLERGVTTAVDAGDSGCITFPGFLEYCIRPAKGRIFTFINLASLGIINHEIGELLNLRYVDLTGLAEVITTHKDICLGIKVRIGREQINGHGFKPLEMALEVGNKLACPIMVHITAPGIPLGELVDRLRPGDIITHLFHGRGQTIIEKGRVLPALRRAQERGVRTDIGHGMGSFAFATAEAALADGFRPDTISCDLHTLSINGPVFDLTTTMSKFIALGMTLDDVVAATTSNAARTIGKHEEFGCLRPGMVGDLTVLDVVEGDFTFHDCEGATRKGSKMLNTAMTIFGGEIVFSRL